MAEHREITRRSFIALGATGVAVLGLSSLAACGNPAAKESKSAGDSKTPEKPAAIKVTDLAGNTLEVPAQVDRIADLWHAHNQIVLMLGAGDRLVGTTDNFKKMAWANVVFPKLADVESLVTGTGANQSVNYEEALKLEPDVCFASSADMVSEGASNGLTVVNVMFQDYEGLRDNVSLTGKILGSEAEKRADAWADLLDENINYVDKKMAGIPEADKVKVLHIVNKSSLTKVDGTDCIVDEWIKLAGGVNAIQKPGNIIEVTMEEIVAADPDVIIIGSGAADAVDDLLTNAAWSGISAVKNKAVYANPTGVFPWDRYSGEEALQVLWAAQKLNPDKFADLDMLKKTKEFYKTFYGFELTDNQAKRIVNAQNPA